MTALGRVVIGIVLIRMAVSYAKGQIETLNTVPARIGRLLAILGLFAGVLFFAWRMYVLRQGPAASIFLLFGPGDFWLSAISAGIALVEGTRILGLRSSKAVP